MGVERLPPTCAFRASRRYPGVMFDLRAHLQAKLGTGTTGATMRRIKRLGTKLEEARWLEVVEATKTVADLALESGKSRQDVDAQLRSFLQALGSDEDDDAGSRENGR